MDKRFFLALLSIYAINSHADLFGPKDYDDCVIESMKGVTSDIAAKAIKQSCEAKFAEKIPDSTDITKFVLRDLSEAKAGFRKLNYNNSIEFAGTFYNNSNYVISEFIVRLSYKDGVSNNNKIINRNFKAIIFPASHPLNESEFFVPLKSVKAPELISWDIVKVMGYKK